MDLSSFRSLSVCVEESLDVEAVIRSMHSAFVLNLKTRPGQNYLFERQSEWGSCDPFKGRLDLRGVFSCDLFEYVGKCVN